MALNRYLLYISYIGKPFVGLQRQVKGDAFSRPNDPSTVQGQLEMALKKLNPSKVPIIYMSSRTDAGVHALNTTVHTDLYREDGVTYDPRTLTICLNRFFTKEEIPIRVQKTFLVPETFNCRHSAISRTYLYRLAVIKVEALNIAPHLELIPIEEFERCLFVCTNTFNVEDMKEASKLFVGLHDFRTFMGRGTRDPDRMTRRTMLRVEVNQVQSKTVSPFSWSQSSKSSEEDYKFYDIYVQGTGFLYRQVRRMVASLIAVAQGKVTLADIKLMLQVPSHRSWNDKIKTVPAYGLYLCEVEYSQSDLSQFRAGLVRAEGPE